MGTHSKRISKGIGYYIIKPFQHHGAICFEVFRPSEVQTLNIVVILVLGFPDLLNIVVELVYIFSDLLVNMVILVLGFSDLLNIMVILDLGFLDLLNIMVILVLVHSFSPFWAKYAILHVTMTSWVLQTTKNVISGLN